MNELWKEKIVAITGATGLIGSLLARCLCQKGAQVIAIGRSEAKLKSVFADELMLDNFHILAGDVTSPSFLDGQTIHYLFHAASPISGSDIRDYPMNVIEANLFGTYNCLEFLRKQKESNGVSGRMFIFSSATAYGNMPLEKDRVRMEEETTCADAIDFANAPYSESKRMIEVMANAYVKQYGLDVVRIRIAYVYGFSKCPPKTAFYEFIRKAIENKPITLNNSGMARRDNIQVDDVVSALILLAEKGVSGEVYNISSNGDGGNYAAIDEIAELIAQSANQVLNGYSVTAVIPAAQTRAAGFKMDNCKLKKLGWEIKCPLKDGIRKTVAEYAKGEHAT